MPGPKLQIEVEATERKTHQIKMLTQMLLLLIQMGHHLIRKCSSLPN